MGKDGMIDLENPFLTPSRSTILFISVITIGTMFVATVSGTYNAIDNLTTLMQLKDNFSNYEISAIQSLCFMGAYFTFFSGLILDRMGPVIAITLGAFFVVAGYFTIAVSALFSTGSTVMFITILIGYLCVGLGSGTTFLCAMGTSIKTLTKNPGLAISLPGICMSLSMAFTIWIENGYLHLYDCSNCWGDAVAALLIFVMSFYFIGIWLIAIGQYYHVPQRSSTSLIVEESTINFDDEYDIVYDDTFVPTSTNTPKTISELLCILFNSFFYVLFIGYFCAISYGLIIVTQTTNIWKTVTGSDDYVSLVSTFFSFANAAANILCGLLYDYTVRKGKISKQLFMTLFFVYCTITLSALGILSIFDTAVTSSTFLQIIFGALMVSIGFGWGCAFTLFPVLTGEVYGSANFGFNFSLVQLGSFLATFTVPNIAALIYSISNSFTVLFLLFGGLSFCAAILFFFSKPKDVSGEVPPFVRKLKLQIMSKLNRN